MTLGFTIRIVFEVLAVAALIVGFLYEDRVIAFEDRILEKFRSGRKDETAAAPLRRRPRPLRLPTVPRPPRTRPARFVPPSATPKLPVSAAPMRQSAVPARPPTAEIRPLACVPAPPSRKRVVYRSREWMTAEIAM